MASMIRTRRRFFAEMGPNLCCQTRFAITLESPSRQADHIAGNGDRGRHLEGDDVMASRPPISGLAHLRRLASLAIFGAAATLSACSSQGSATADPAVCANGINDGGNVVGNGNTTSISIDSGNVFAPSSPGSTSVNNSVGNVVVGNGGGSSVCCVQNVCCVHSGGGGADISSSCPPG
jgi:hypothetical protein